MSAELVAAFSGFLKWGPIGLPALMLVLVVVALAVRKLEPARERTLTRFMYVGVVCFTLALIIPIFTPDKAVSHHPLHINVYPLDLGKEKKLPMPIININNTKLNSEAPRTYSIKSEATAVIDVSDAINYVQEVQSQNAKQRQVINETFQKTDIALSQIKAASQLIDRSCPGGSNGVSPANAGKIIDLNNEVGNFIAASRASFSSILQASPPSPPP